MLPKLNKFGSIVLCSIFFTSQSNFLVRNIIYNKFICLQLLSRAFRNRFVELHFGEIPSSELETILHQRCALPASYAKKMVAVMGDLQVFALYGDF